MIIKLGPRKAAILRAAGNGNWFLADRHNPDYSHCLKLFERGYLVRDFPNIFYFHITDEGRAAIAAHDAELAEASA